MGIRGSNMHGRQENEGVADAIIGLRRYCTCSLRLLVLPSPLGMLLLYSFIVYVFVNMVIMVMLI